MNTLKLLLPLLFALPASAQVRLLKQQNLKQWSVAPANYSGITPIGNNRFALVGDKEQQDGFYEMEIVQDSITGEVTGVKPIAFHGNGLPARDAEGIAYCPQRGTLFISAEDDQQIIEYTTKGERTGHCLQVPALFGKGKIYSNYGFEALGYDEVSGTFWTTTENALRADSPLSTQNGGQSVNLRLQQFSADGTPLRQQAYPLDRPLLKRKAQILAHGVVAITPLGDGSLLVLEREFLVTPKKLGSYVVCRLYRWDTTTQAKTLQAEWSSIISLRDENAIANYEGMCLGIKLADGSQTILLINDSQGGYGNRLFRLKDYIRVGIIPDTKITDYD